MNELNTDGVCAESREDQVRKLYAKLALNPEQDFGWNKGKDNAKQLGYDQRMLDQIPDVVWESSAAVGNPFSVGPINKGETVVDLGCGAGTPSKVLMQDTNRYSVAGADLSESALSA